MDKKLKAKWVKALRGGRYKQTMCKLYDGKGYCCLGVLGRLMGKSRKQILDVGVNPGYLPHDIENELTHMNDSEGKSFKLIADYIEAKL